MQSRVALPSSRGSAQGTARFPVRSHCAEARRTSARPIEDIRVEQGPLLKLQNFYF